METVCAVLSITTVTGRNAPEGPICSGQLIFEDNFDKYDLRTWKHETTFGGGSSNNQFQLFNNNRTNSFIDDGVLHLKPSLLTNDTTEAFLSSGTMDLNSWFPQAPCTNAQYDGCYRIGNATTILNPIKSARINTADSFAFAYGTLEIRARAPAGDWLWPAIWLAPRWLQYSTFPASGEIDLMGSRGNRKFTLNGEEIGVEQITSTLHWGPNPANDKYKLSLFTKNNASGWHTDFHRYQLTWTPDNITFFIDDESLGTVTPTDGGFWEMGQFNTTTLNNPWRGASKMAPFDTEFFLVIYLAIGGTSYFSDGGINQGYVKPWLNSDGPSSRTKFWNGRANWMPTWNMDTSDSGHFLIDYVRVWAL